MKEALRIDAPADMFPYFSTTDVELPGKHGNYTIPAYVNFTPISYMIHNNPLVWHEPRRFNPERWNPDAPEFKVPGTDKKRHPYSFIPFSLGPRNCLG